MPDRRSPPARSNGQPMRPLDPPMVPFAAAGTVVWAVAGLVLLLASAPAGPLWTCLAGVLVGCGLLVLMLGHDRHRSERSHRG